MTAALEAAVRVDRGDFALDLRLALATGETLALLGPNGSGKSTLLAVLAGLLHPAAGEVRLGGRVLTRTAGGRVHVAPERRRVVLLGQDPMLFPHLSALENVAFAPRSRGARASEARGRARGRLTAVGLADRADARPGALSGGQRQRVAIARALAAEPELLLLDEPLAALDVATAAHVRALLAERIAERAAATIVVTHDVVDAVTLADRCAILQDGRIVDDGPTARVLGAPRTDFIAALAGLNRIEGAAAAGGVALPGGGVLPADLAGRAPGAAVAAVFRPSAVALDVGRGPGLDARVLRVEPSSAAVRVVVEGSVRVGADLDPGAAAALGVRPGLRVRWSVPADAVRVQAPSGGGEGERARSLP